MGPAMVAAVLEEMTDIPLHERDNREVVVWIDNPPVGIGHLDGDGATLPQNGSPREDHARSRRQAVCPGAA